MTERMLAPWDALKYFATPTVTIVMAGGGAQQLCVNNPNRVGLIIDCQPGTTVTVSPDPAVLITNGLVLSDTKEPLMLTFAEWGVLVTVPWFAVSAAASAVTVIQVTLNKWTDG